MAAAVNLPEQLEASLYSLVPVDGCLTCLAPATYLSNPGLRKESHSPRTRGAGLCESDVLCARHRGSRRNRSVQPSMLSATCPGRIAHGDFWRKREKEIIGKDKGDAVGMGKLSERDTRKGSEDRQPC